MHDSVMLGTLLKHAYEDGFRWLMGLEVSTKAELMLVLCLWDDLLTSSRIGQPRQNAQRRMTVICNGWKDAEYLGLVDSAIVAGLDVVVILENELDARFVIQSYNRRKVNITSPPVPHLSSEAAHATPTQVLPTLGLRARLQEQHPGRCVNV